MILIHGATIVTVDPQDSVLFDGAIAIEGKRILDIGPSAALRGRYPAADLVDGHGKAVMPGFANTHTHFNLTLARGIFEDLSPPNQPPFDQLGLSPLPLPRLSAAENAVMCQLGALEALRCGTTAVLEDGVSIGAYAVGIAASGLRLLLTERVWDKANGHVGLAETSYQAAPDVAAAGLQRVRDLHRQWDGAAEGRIRVGIAAWAPDMCSPGALRQIQETAQQLGVPRTIHLNQLWGEVAAVQATRGCLPTEYLAREGFLGADLIAAHCRCMAAGEEELLGRAGASVAFNAAIAARRGLSPRIRELGACGCRICIGTDNMAEDMVEAMRVGMLMERVRRGDGRSPTPTEALRWATVHGYRAMGVSDAGFLVPGNRADLILVELQRAHLVPLMRPVASFVHQGQGRDVDSVMVDGHWLMRGGTVLSMDEAHIVAEADRIGRSAWQRMLRAQPGLDLPDGFEPTPAT